MTSARIRHDHGVRWLIYDEPPNHIEVQLDGPVLVVHHSRLPTGDQLERVLDAWWALREEAGLTEICIEYRSGDPFETYTVRS